MRRRTVLATAGALLTGTIAGCTSASAPTATASPTDTSVEATTTPTDTPAEATTTPADPVSTDGAWPQVGHDAQHTRHVDARGPRDGAEIAWEALSSPFPPVVDDALYLTGKWTSGATVSLEAVEGAERWTNGDLPPSRFAPALGAGQLFVLSRAEGNVVRLHALDTETGEQVWVREAGITASSGTPPSGPTVEGETVYVPSNRGVVAVDAATGDVEWTATLGPHVVDTDGPTWRTDWAKPTVTAGRAITFDVNDSYQQGREVYAVDTESGERDWTTELDLSGGWSLKWRAVAGSGRVFVSALRPAMGAGGGAGGDDDEADEWTGAERVFALEADSGAVAWDRALTGKTLRPVAYADDTLYVGEWLPGPDTGRLHALDAADGSVVWCYETDAGAMLSPTVAPDTVYVGQGEELAAVSRESGERRWRLGVGGRPGSPVVVGDTAYVRTNSGLLAIREP